MSKAAYGLYVLIVTLALTILLSRASDFLVAATGLEWLGSTFVVVLVSLTLADLIVAATFGRPTPSNPKSPDMKDQY